MDVERDRGANRAGILQAALSPGQMNGGYTASACSNCLLGAKQRAGAGGAGRGKATLTFVVGAGDCSPCRKDDHAWQFVLGTRFLRRPEQGYIG
jgi:hypothetical protein